MLLFHARVFVALYELDHTEIVRNDGHPAFASGGGSQYGDDERSARDAARQWHIDIASSQLCTTCSRVLGSKLTFQTPWR